MQGLSRFQNDGLSRALVILPVWVLGAALVLYLKDVYRRGTPAPGAEEGQVPRPEPAAG
jgi:hypothetical protein